MLSGFYIAAALAATELFHGPFYGAINGVASQMNLTRKGDIVTGDIVTGDINANGRRYVIQAQVSGQRLSGSFSDPGTGALGKVHGGMQGEQLSLWVLMPGKMMPIELLFTFGVGHGRP